MHFKLIGNLGNSDNLDMLLKGLIIIWITLTTVILMHLHSWHSYVFHVKADKIPKSFLEVNSKINALHFLAAECTCSTKILNHLLERRPQEGVSEKIIILGNLVKESEELRSAGFQVHSISLNELKQQNWLSATPLFITYNKQKEVLYAGGYTSGAITPFAKFYDEQILIEVKNNKPISVDYPIRGCAASLKLKEMLDPLGLKYKKVSQNE